MTGTAETEAEEFAQDLQARRRRSSRPTATLIRDDHADVVYKTEREKFDAVVEEIGERHEQGQPVLVGTVSIEKSERLSELLKQRGHPARRAERQAPRARGGDHRPGRPQGRGHDRHQHGRPRHRHPARRQSRVPGQGRSAGSAGSIRPPRRRRRGRRRAGRGRRVNEPEHERGGRARAACTSSAPSATSRAASTTSCAAASGRQGDPGSSRFFLSLEDDLMRIFGSERIQAIMERLGMEEDVPIEHGWSRAPSSTRRSGSRAQLRHPQAPARVRRRDEQAARDHLRHAPADPRRRRARPTRSASGSRTSSTAPLDSYAPEEAHAEEWDLAGLGEALHRQFDVRIPPRRSTRTSPPRTALRRAGDRAP